MLVWQNFTSTQKPKYYPWQYFGKILQKPNANLTSILQSSNSIIGNILQKSNAILAISYQQPKTTTFFDE